MSESHITSGTTGDGGHTLPMTPAEREIICRILRELAEHDADYHRRPDWESINQARLTLKNSPVVPIDSPIPTILKEIRRHGDDYHHRSDPAFWKRALSAVGLSTDTFSYETLLNERRSRPDPFEDASPVERRPWKPGVERRRNFLPRGEQRASVRPHETEDLPRVAIIGPLVFFAFMLAILVSFLVNGPTMNVIGGAYLLIVWAGLTYIGSAFVFTVLAPGYFPDSEENSAEGPQSSLPETSSATRQSDDR